MESMLEFKLAVSEEPAPEGWVCLKISLYVRNKKTKRWKVQEEQKVYGRDWGQAFQNMKVAMELLMKRLSHRLTPGWAEIQIEEFHLKETAWGWMS
jgi:hypothetical protein